MVIEVPSSLQKQLGLNSEDTTVALEGLSDAQKNILLANQKAFEQMTAEDIAKGQLSATENIQRDVAFLAATTRGQAVKAFKSVAEAAGFTGEDSQKFVTEMNKLGTSEKDNKRYEVIKAESNKNFKSMLPFLEKAVELKSDNDAAKKTLLSVYNALEMTDKYKALKAKQ